MNPPAPVTSTRSCCIDSAPLTVRAVESLQSRQLQRGEDNKPGIVDCVAPPQSPWLLEEAEEPFQTGLLHPRRRLADATGVKVKCGSDAQYHASLKQAYRFMDPALLLRCAEAHPDDMSAARIDPLRDVAQLAPGQSSEGRAVDAGDLEPGVLSLQPANQFHGDARGPTVEVVTNSKPCAQSTYLPHQ